MRLGNDIVDLEAARGEHERFASRILSPLEWENYETAGASARLLWSYWAAKEAAFKAYTQEHPTRFAPLRWEVSPDFKEVVYSGESFRLRLLQSEESVYAEVTDSPWEAVLSATQTLLGETMPEVQKREVRRLAIKLAVDELGLKLGALRVLKREGIPQLWDEDSGASYTLSLTHHGRFLGASILKAPPRLRLSSADFERAPGQSY